MVDYDAGRRYFESGGKVVEDPFTQTSRYKEPQRTYSAQAGATYYPQAGVSGTGLAFGGVGGVTPKLHKPTPEEQFRQQSLPTGGIDVKPTLVTREQVLESIKQPPEQTYYTYHVSPEQIKEVRYAGRIGEYKKAEEKVIKPERGHVFDVGAIRKQAVKTGFEPTFMGQSILYLEPREKPKLFPKIKYTPSPQPKTEIKLTPPTPEQEREALGVIQKAGPLEKAGLYARTLLSPEGYELIGSAIRPLDVTKPSKKFDVAEITPPEVVAKTFARDIQAMRRKEKSEESFLRGMTEAWESPVVAAELSFGLGALGGAAIRLGSRAAGPLAATRLGSGLARFGTRIHAAQLAEAGMWGAYGATELYGIQEAKKVGKGVAIGRGFGAIGELGTFGLGLRVGKKYLTAAEVRERVTELPSGKKARFEEFNKELDALLKHELSVKEVSFKGMGRLPARGQRITKEFLIRKQDILGGSFAQRSQVPIRGRSYLESDIDIYTRGMVTDRARILARELKSAGIKRVSVVPGTGRVTVRGRKAIEFRPLEQLVYNIESVSGPFSLARRQITRSPEGIGLLKVGIQARRKLVGAYLEGRYGKDFPDFLKMMRGMRRYPRIKRRLRAFPKEEIKIRPKRISLKTELKPPRVPPSERLPTKFYKGYGYPKGTRYPRIPPYPKGFPYPKAPRPPKTPYIDIPKPERSFYPRVTRYPRILKPPKVPRTPKYPYGRYPSIPSFPKAPREPYPVRAKFPHLAPKPKAPPVFGSAELGKRPRRARRKKRKVPREYRYTPSLVGIEKGLRIPKPPKFLTGLEIRPMIGRKKKKKRR